MTARGLAPVRQSLANGAVIVAKETRTTPAVTFVAAMAVGSACDPDDRLGLAHLLSRLLDRGTVSRSAEQIAELLDSRGATLSVTAARHLMLLTCTCLAEDFETLLDLVGEMLMEPAFPEAEIDTRRRETITAIRQDEDSPAAVAAERCFADLYPPGHPYGRRSKGTLETVSRITRNDLIELHRAAFGPRALTLVVVGDVPEQRAIDVAVRVFGGWSGNRMPPLTLPPVEPPAGRRLAVIPMMNKAQVDIVYGFTTIRRADPAFYAMTLMNHALGQHAMGGRLGTSIREQQGMAYYVFSAFDASIGEGPLVVRAGVAPANVDRTIASIDREVAALAASGVTDRELDESKAYLCGSLPRTLETNAGIAAFLQQAEFFGLGLDYDVRLPGLLRAVTADEVHNVARRFLVPERATIAVAGPWQGPASIEAAG